MFNFAFLRQLRPDGKDYPSYTDFFRLCQLCNFKCLRPEEVNLKDETFTLICPVMHPQYGIADRYANVERKARVISWLLERPSTRAPFLPFKFDQIWLSDLALARKFAARDKRVRYVPLGGHADLCPWTRNIAVKLPPKKYDFAVMAYKTALRVARHPHLAKYSISPDCYPPERDQVLMECRGGLCLHQDTLPYIEPLRYVLFAMARLPICAELCVDTYPYQVYPINNPQEALADADGFAELNYMNLATVMTFDRCIHDAMLTDDQLPVLV